MSATKVTQKIELLLSNAKWKFLEHAAWDRYALMDTMYELENELIAQDHSEPEVNLK